MTILTIEKPLREKLGDEAVDSLVRLINQSQEAQKNDILEFVGEKFERRLSEEIRALEERLTRKITQGENKLLERITEGENRLSERIIEVESGMLERITDGENRTAGRITDGDSKLDKRITSVETKLAEVHADLIKWMFIFWVGQVGVILGILFAFFK